MPQKIATSLILLLLASTLVEAKVVSLDLVKVYRNYSLVQEANSTIDDAEARFKRILQTAEKELSELEKKGKEKEIASKKIEIQDVIDEQVEELHDKREYYNTTINRNIARLLSTLAKEKSYDLVLEKGYLLVPIEDISDEFISRLESAKKTPIK